MLIQFAHGNDKYAVLIGVSKYPSLDQRFQLIGPRNDALLLHQVLQQQGFPADNIQLLTEDHPLAKPPTRQNILTSLDQVLDNAKQGDFVYLHFSGHGSQQPARAHDNEIDGLDEIFLPADTKNWNNQIKSVENALLDDDIATYLDQFTNQGVFVWLVFDSCHSGTMTRSHWQSRKITPNQLGVPRHRSGLSSANDGPPISLSPGSDKRASDKRASGKRASGNSASGNSASDNTAAAKNASGNTASGEPAPTPDKAGYVAFFAAQTTEETPEMAFPKGAEKGHRYGLFTYQLIKAMSTNPSLTYRQFAEQILLNYRTYPWQGSRPMFAGTALDTPLFGSKLATDNSHQQWLINRHAAGYELAAGSLHSLTPGSILAILPTPSAPVEQALGFAEITTTEALSSQIKTITWQHKGKQFIQLASIPEQAYARLVETKLDLSLTVSLLENKVTGTPEKLAEILTELQKKGIGKLQLNWVDTAAAADIRIYPMDDTLILLTDGEPLPCALDKRANENSPLIKNSEIGYQDSECARSYIRVAITSIDATSTLLSDKLQTVAKAQNLMRLGAELGSGSLDVKLHVKHRNTGNIEAYTAADIPRLLAGDEVSLTISNYLEQALDITVLFVGSDYSITTVFPRKNQFNRFMEEEEKTLRLGRINTKTTGVERLIIIASQVSLSASPGNFSFLSQAGLTRARANLDTASQLFLRAGFGGQSKSRGAMAIKQSVKSQLDLQTLSWITAHE
ncbi:MAG: caspase family protein [Pseudomonadales bacterium]|nr:caspase family protein [Pseudomonadales bacterium]